MRLRSIALITALVAVAACGGGSGSDIDARPRIDSPPTIDSPPAVSCTLKPSYMTLSLGSAATPVQMTPGQGVGQDMNGNYYLAIFGNLSTVDPDLTVNHGLEMLFVDNTGMFATAGAAGPWSGTPTPQATAVDVGTTALPCGACAIGFGGMAMNAPPSMTNPETQDFLADSGTLTLATFSAPPVDGAQSDFSGSFDTLSMTGVDPATGNPLTPGCTTTVMKLNYVFHVTWGVAAAPTTDVSSVAKRVDFSL